MSLTTKIRTYFIRLSGYFIYKQADLPVGIDFKQDLVNKFNINPISIFDVGANYGQTALHYNSLFNTAKIFSFEPVKASYEKLINETQTIKNISCHNIALGEENNNVEIYLHKEENSQLNSLKAINSNQTGITKETINVVTLDNFAKGQKIETIDLLKIDTEGFELEVLKGAYSFLKNKKIKAILCEVALSKRNTRNTQLNIVIDFLDKYDYFFVGLYETNITYFKSGLAYSNALFILKNS